MVQRACRRLKVLQEYSYMFLIDRNRQGALIMSFKVTRGHMANDLYVLLRPSGYDNR